MSQEGIVNFIQNSPSVPTTFTADVGSATPAANNLNLFTGSNLLSTGSGSTVTFTLTGLQNHSLVVGNGTTAFTNLGVASDGQIPIGSTGADPVLNTITAGTGISITNGAGTITIAVSGSAVVETLTGNTGGAISPTAGNINTVGTGSITIAGSGSTLTTQLTGLTNHSLLVGAGTATITNLGVATNGQLPIGSTGADPVLAALSAGTGITITNGAGTISIATSATGTVNTLTGNSGGAISPTAGNINTLGTGSITIAGVGSTLTTQLTGLTNHNVQVGAGTATLTQVAPSATSGIPLVSNGASSDPSFSTALIAGGGTASTSFNINGAVYSNTTTTGALQAATLTSGQLLIGGTTTPAAATISAGTGITVTNGNNSITIASTGAGFAWTDENSAFNALSNNGYFVTGTTTGTLPASPSQGDMIEFNVDDTLVTTVTANTGQKIRIGSAVSASAGTATSNARGDALTLIYRTSGTTWHAQSVIGTWSVT